MFVVGIGLADALTCVGETKIYPVPQGQRGLLWDWSGQLRHLPPPSVSFITSMIMGGLVYSHAGGEQ